MAVEGSVPQPGVIVPHLVVRDAAEAVDFYIRAFGASVLYRSPSPSGVGEHIHLKVWSSLVQVSTEEPAQRGDRIEGALLASPETLAGSTCVFQIGVDDVDEVYRHAVDQGERLPHGRPPTCSGETATAGSAIHRALTPAIQFRQGERSPSVVPEPQLRPDLAPANCLRTCLY